MAFVNQRHITEENLNDAITTVINAYAQFPLQRLWGLGKSASADGMKWDLYPQNLMSEYHIRYGHWNFHTKFGAVGFMNFCNCLDVAPQCLIRYTRRLKRLSIDFVHSMRDTLTGCLAE